MHYHMTATDIFDYWNGLRVDGQPPLRSSISPADIRSALPDLIMLEADEDGTERFRLAGTRICALFNRELRGLPFSALWSPEQAAHAESLANAVLQYACPFMLSVTGFTQDGSAHRFELVLLPLRSGGSNCDRLLGALIAHPRANTLRADAMIGGLHIDRSRPLADLGSAIRANQHRHDTVQA